MISPRAMPATVTVAVFKAMFVQPMKPSVIEMGIALGASAMAATHQDRKPKSTTNAVMVSAMAKDSICVRRRRT